MVYAQSYTNTVTTSNGRKISMPAEGSQYDVPSGLKKRTIDTVAKIMPAFADRQVDYWRLCWDGITPSQHQLITKHPNINLGNVYLALGGSLHSWKFLPVIGKYVTNILLGNSNGQEKDENWSWKREGWQHGAKRGAHANVIPQVELKDLL
jgi:sarcosine oxidase / L-pipecolate oxidase